MKSVLIHHHPGLGDHLMCHGIVREYAKRHDRVGLFSLPRNFASVAFMYRDLKNVEVISASEEEAKKLLSENELNVGGKKYDLVKVIGFENLDRHSGISLEKQFYEMAEVPLSKIWDGFFVQRNFEKETALFKRVTPQGDYAFIHEDVSRNYKIERNMIDAKYTIFSPDPSLTENIFDYCTLIERAKEIHVIDSSFMFLIDCLHYENPAQKLYIHRYSRENEAWKLPILKKHWTILTLTESNPTRGKRVSTFFDRTEIFFLTNPFWKRITRKLYRTFGWRTRLQKKGSPGI